MLLLLLRALVATGPEPAVCTVTEPVYARSDGPLASSVAPKSVAGPTCADPSPDLAASCAAQAERALASTVRLEFAGPAGAIGHGTVVDGRYVLTHNHYPVGGDVLSRGGDGLVTAISVFRAGGELVLWHTPLACFSVSAADEEVLLLDFGVRDGVGFFDRAGIPSAETLSFEAMALHPGSEVAQIDWDSAGTRVGWVRVIAVHDEGRAPYLTLDSDVQHGASGGGVFLAGRHIGNNWMRCTIQLTSGEVTRRYSVVALNR